MLKESGSNYPDSAATVPVKEHLPVDGIIIDHQKRDCQDKNSLFQKIFVLTFSLKEI